MFRLILIDAVRLLAELEQKTPEPVMALSNVITDSGPDLAG